MTRKDYVKAAKIIQEYSRHPLLGHAGSRTATAMLTQAFVEFFQGDNPRFDVERFRTACK